MAAVVLEFPDIRIDAGGRQRMRPAPRALPAGTYARRRIVALVLLVAMAGMAYVGGRAALGALGGGPLTTPERRPAQLIAERVYVVQPGDTLWTIAKALRPHGDLRLVVQELQARNGGAALQVGDRIQLPSEVLR